VAAGAITLPPPLKKSLPSSFLAFVYRLPIYRTN